MPRLKPRLFEPITLNGLTIPHRLWVAPMCQYSSVDGMPGDWHLVHLGSFAIGRAGLIMTEAAAVSAEGRISPDDVGIWNDEQADAWRRVVDFVHGMDRLIGQIKVEADPARRNDAIREALLLANRELPVVAIHQPLIPWVMRRNVTTWFSPVNTVYFSRTRMISPG